MWDSKESFFQFTLYMVLKLCVYFNTKFPPYLSSCFNMKPISKFTGIFLLVVCVNFHYTDCLPSLNSNKIYQRWIIMRLNFKLARSLSSSKLCIELRFQRILKDFFMMIKSCGIQSRLLQKLIKSYGIQLRQLRFFFQSNKICWYSIEISHHF
jgi:hypothetical protein